LDDYEHAFLNDYENRAFLWEYLGGPCSNDAIDARQHLFDVDYWGTKGSYRNVDYATQYLLRYRLLDILVDMTMTERYYNTLIIPRVPPPHGTTRLAKIQSSLSDWRSCITKFESMMKNHDRYTDQKTEVPSFRSLPVETSLVHAGVLNLLSAQRHFNEAKFNKAVLNVELAAFTLSWFGMVGNLMIYSH
jgi:hypothetical protein